MDADEFRTFTTKNQEPGSLTTKAPIGSQKAKGKTVTKAQKLNATWTETALG
jgi:hypothetical protein